MNISGALEKILLTEPSLYEEDSYYFLAFYQAYKDWLIYDSKEIGISGVKALVDTFVSFHGKIPFPSLISDNFEKDQIVPKFWSAVPLGIFKYKMIESGTYHLLDSVKPVPGFLVEGAYWDNGFFYIVKNDDNIIEIKLFIDRETKSIHGYPSSI